MTATGVAAAPLVSMARSMGGAVTAQEVVDRIKKNIGVEWKPDTVDTFKAGDPSAAVTGIVTTSLASLDVLGHAVKKGANFIVTSEPTFYSRADTPTPPIPRRFERGPNGTVVPLEPPPAASFGSGFQGQGRIHQEAQPYGVRLATTGACARPIRLRRDSAMRSAGRSSPAPAIQRTGIPEASLEAVVDTCEEIVAVARRHAHCGQSATGRAQGWISSGIDADSGVHRNASRGGFDYCRRSARVGVGGIRARHDALGGKKALILIGRIVSEDPGMQVCAQWLKTIVPEVASTWVSAGDPYWRPNA